MIIANIDVTKIDKSLFVKGEKGTYTDLALIDTPDGKYGNDFMVVQGVSKEARERGEKGPIIGNAKIVERRDNGTGHRRNDDLPRRPSQSAPPQREGEGFVPNADDDDDIPF